MSFADASAVDGLMRLLSDHRAFAYVLLFLGALAETVLPLALLVPGEVVFLAGATLAGLHRLDLLAVSLVLIGGGLAGDHVSYWIGHAHGPALFRRLQHVPGLRRLSGTRQRARARAFMHRRGAVAVFLARFAGPISWLTPMLAGTHRMRYATFARYNTPAVVLGIGQFIVIGYLAGRHAGAAQDMLWRHAWVVLPVAVVTLLLIFRVRHVSNRLRSWRGTRSRRAG
jgi:membrane-associated protein